MGLGKTYSTKYLADSNNNTGVAGQVLISTSTGINWSDGSDIIGGPYVTLATAQTISGAKTFNNDVTLSNTYLLGVDKLEANKIVIGTDTSSILGNVGIGAISPGEKLEITGNSITRSKTRGLGTNYATSEGWVASSGVSSAVGFFGGNFSSNGGDAENKIEYDIGPFGSRELVWMSIPETVSNDDGGWNKSMDGFNNSANNGFMSVVYVRRDAGTAAGTFYHGCSGSDTLNLSGSAATNPYYSNIGINNLPTDVWCVAIGIIHATNDTTTTNSVLGGIYRLDTGQKIQSSATFRQKTSNATQQQRVYHYYSTSPTAQLDFANPGFYILDGSEPTLGELLGSGSADDVFWSANGNDIYNDNSGKVFINASTSIPNRAEEFQVTGRQIITNTGTAAVALLLGYNSSGTNSVQLGRGRTADGSSYIDLNGEVMSAGDYGFRIMRRSGVNAITDLIQVGTGNLTINALNGADTVFTNTNVGIGDTGPNTKLQVSTDSPTNNVAVSIGDGWVGSSSYHKEGGLLLISGTSQDATQTGAGIAFQTRNTQNSNYWKSSVIMDRDGAMRFTLGGAGTVAGSEDFTILSGGNVGIGATSPSHKLEVGLTSSVPLASQPAIPLMISNDGNSVDGRVLLQVKHDVVNAAGAIAAGYQMTAAAVTSGTASYYNSLIFLESAGSGSETVHSAPKNIEFYTNNYNTPAGAGTDYTQLGNLAFELQADGDAIFYDNVGIGTTSPTNGKLVIDSTANQIAIETGTAGDGRLNIGHFSNGTFIGTYGDDGGAADNLRFGTHSGDTRMTISSAGAIQFNNYNSTNNTGTPTYLLGTDASGNVVKTALSPGTSTANSLYDLIPNGAFTTTYAFTSTAGTYAEVMSGDDVITETGTYSIQMLVNDYAVGGTQYDEKYSGVMTWHKTSTNDAGVGSTSEIVLHRSGHAGNQGITYLRTRETTSADNNELKLEIMCNKTYTGASNVVFKFVRLI